MLSASLPGKKAATQTGPSSIFTLTTTVAIAVIGAILFLAAWPVGSADAATVSDPAGDLAGSAEQIADYDIVSVRSVVNRGMLYHAVTVDGEAKVRDDHTEDGSQIQIELNTEAGRPGDCNGNSRDPLGRSEYIIMTSGVPTLLDCTGTGIPEGESIRAVERDDTLITAISSDAIGDPARYRWLASTRFVDDEGAEQIDFAPEREDGSPAMTVQKTGSTQSGWQKCAGPKPRGAGSYNVKALRMQCRLARRIAQLYPVRPGVVRQAGWNCATRRVGYELSAAQCVLRTDVLRAVRFNVGA